MPVQNLNKNYDTIATTVQSLAVAWIGQLDNGDPAQVCIVDAAIGLLKAGIVESAGELVNHGYALLNGMNQNVSASLAATLSQLLQNPEEFKLIEEELNSELFDD